MISLDDIKSRGGIVTCQRGVEGYWLQKRPTTRSSTSLAWSPKGVAEVPRVRTLLDTQKGNVIEVRNEMLQAVTVLCREFTDLHLECLPESRLAEVKRFTD
jgi:hypothetical protein